MARPRLDAAPSTSTSKESWSVSQPQCVPVVECVGAIQADIRCRTAAGQIQHVKFGTGVPGNSSVIPAQPDGAGLDFQIQIAGQCWCASAQGEAQKQPGTKKRMIYFPLFTIALSIDKAAVKAID